MKNSLLALLLCFALTPLMSQSVSITFEVNMSYQIDQGAFSPAVEFVDVAGTFNGWGSTLQPLTDPDSDGIWKTTISGFTPGSTIEFKFRYNGEWDDREEFPGAGNNRVHTVGDSDETLTFWYEDEEPPTGPAVAGISSSTNFAFTGSSVTFYEDAGGLVEEYEWTFEGGSPSTSSASSVNVTYDEPGTYDVTLRVSNSFSEDEMILEDYVTVEDQGTDDLDWWNEAVFYEIFVRSFYDSDGDGIGDFRGIIEKLDYLNDGNPNSTTDLGITGIWLMPIHDSPSYHGYDVNDYRSINPDYGTMDDFRDFLDAAHERGIKVIIDLVLNHSSTEIDWFQNARSSVNADKRNWYRWSTSNPNYSGPWGQSVWHGSGTGYYYGLFWGGMPDLNYEEPEVVDEMFDITKFWLEDVGIDGFRLDAVKYIKEEGSDLEDLASTHAFWRDWVAVTKESNPDALSVGEAWTSTEKIVPYVVNDGIDFCFEFDLASAILGAVKSSNTQNLESQINKVINSYPYYQFGTFLTNHDLNRLMNELSSSEVNTKLASALYLTLPGVPFIYYGEEVGMLGSKPDENIRRPMSWSSDEHAGFSSTNPWNGPASNYETHNVEAQLLDSNSLLNWYRTIIRYRARSQALQTGTYQSLSTSSSAVIGYQRVAQNEQVLVLVNTSNQEQQLSINPNEIGINGTFVNLMDTTDQFELNGSSSSVLIGSKEAMILVPKGEEIELGTELIENFSMYPNPVMDDLHLEFDYPFSYALWDLNGKYHTKGESEAGSTILDTRSLSNGFYLLQVQFENRIVTRKVVIKH